MILLIKFPTRQRPDKFFSVLDRYYDYIEDLDNVKFVVSCDTDDMTMNNKKVIDKLSSYKNLTFYFGSNKSKIEAINADMGMDNKWGVCLLASDDMIPQIKGFDNIIRNEMKKNFKDTDGVLWFPDGIQGELNTLCILGKKYYDRFNYIYNPSYISLWCDNEFHVVANMLNKQILVDKCIIKHEHPVWGFGVSDELLKKNDTYNQDKIIFDRRKNISFSIYDYIDENEMDKMLTFSKIEEKEKINILNKFVDEVYIINLERRKDRLENITNQLNRFDINFKRFNAVDGKHEGITGAVGCLRSHLGVIRHAISKGHQKIAIFEDDIILCDDFSDRFEYYSKNVPDDWEVMYLGCGYIWGIKPTISVPPYIFNIHSCHGCFAMILDNKNGFFQKILNIATPEKKAIDNYYAENILPKAYIFEPFFVKTLNTLSDISDRKDSFSYEGIDSSFKNVVELKVDSKKQPQTPQIQSTKKTTPIQTPIQQPSTKTNKEICEDYLRTGNFQVVMNGKLVFDSTTSDKSNVTFFDNYFQIYGKSFLYGGMIIKRI